MAGWVAGRLDAMGIEDVLKVAGGGVAVLGAAWALFERIVGFYSRGKRLPPPPEGPK